MYFFIADSFLLAAMLLDRYVAVCRPVMSLGRCLLVVGTSWLSSPLHSLGHTLLASCFPFCASNRVPHFFCDIFPLLNLSCSNSWLNALVLHTKGALAVNMVLVFILLSYDAIVSAVLKVPSGTVIWVYFQPSSSFSAEKDALAAVMYTVVTPMLNPFIYTLRNDETKWALRKAISRMVASPGTVPLYPIPALQHIYLSSQFSIIRKFAESAIHTILQIIYEDIEQNWPQDRPLGHST
ncbi:unnamed protein product [Lepidochelys kempii]